MSHSVTLLMLTRAEFDAGCKEVVGQSRSPALTGWSWNEHPTLPGFGFLSRIVHHFRRKQSSSTDIDVDLRVIEQDDAQATRSPETLVCQQYVVYSQTFQVPTFYFTIHDSTGSPLPLVEIVDTTLFHLFAFEDTEQSTFGLTRPGSSFPILSQGEHPTLGIPCWYLHPCATDEIVTELMTEADTEGDAKVVRWLEVWFMVLGMAVDTSI